METSDTSGFSREKLWHNATASYCGSKQWHQVPRKSTNLPRMMRSEPSEVIERVSRVMGALSQRVPRRVHGG